MSNDLKRKRWSACGVCHGCLATDCGECINCLDKSKFGGQGVRKQSCVVRRCVRSNSCSRTYSNSSSGTALADGGAPDRRALGQLPGGGSATVGDDPERALFWAAVSGCLALNSQHAASEDDEGSTSHPISTQDRDSSSASPRTSSPTHSLSDSDDRSHRGHMRPNGSSGMASAMGRSLPAWGAGAGERAGALPYSTQRTSPLIATAGVGGADSFCCYLASVMASDKRLQAQPLIVRAVERAGLLDTRHAMAVGAMGQVAKLADSLVDPSLARTLYSGLVGASTALPAPPPRVMTPAERRAGDEGASALSIRRTMVEQPAMMR